MTHNWTKEASSAISALYTEAIDWSTKHSSPAPDLNSSPLGLNLSLREQNRLNKNDPTRKKMWVAGVAKWKQEIERKWKATNAREVASLRGQVSF